MVLFSVSDAKAVSLSPLFLSLYSLGLRACSNYSQPSPRCVAHDKHLSVFPIRTRRRYTLQRGVLSRRSLVDIGNAVA